MAEDIARELAAQETFRVRWRVVSALAVVHTVLQIARAQWVKNLLPAYPLWLNDLRFWSGFLLAGVVVWATWCPACRGWLKLDLRTCSSCKRVFKREL